jgi:hypothetical protein
MFYHNFSPVTSAMMLGAEHEGLRIPRHSISLHQCMYVSHQVPRWLKYPFKYDEWKIVVDHKP